MTDAVDDRDAEPQRHVGYLTRRAQQRHMAAWTRIASTEISSVQYTILVVLDRLGEASQRVLCDEADLDRSTIADLVARMERKGLIARQRDPGDARRNTVTLTDAGRGERLRLRPLVEQVQEALMASMSEEDRRALRAGLHGLLD